MTTPTSPHPADPQLPGLSRALDPRVVGGWLNAEGPASCELLSYRPLRRAVVRVTVDGRRFYVKLWQPARAAGYVRRHRVLDAAGVGPRIAAEPEPGVLIVHDVDGVTLARRLADWNSTGKRLPEASAVLALLDRLPAELLAFPTRDAWADRADFHGAAAAVALPDHADEIGRIVARIEGVLASRPAAPRVPVHGDFYEANVLVAGTRFTSVIDVDTAGPGRRVDDLACLLGHLAVLPDLSPEHYALVGAVTRAWASEFERHVDPVELRARTAGVILSLIAGTTREHGLARLAECRSWLERAEVG
jgi:Phosphotransferase enzyme family